MNIKQLLRKIVLKIRGEIGAVDADLQSAKRDISGLQSGKADKSDVSEVDIDLEGTGTIVSIPENTTGYGTIEKLGGKSYKSENLLVLSDVAETTTNGITYSIKDGVMTLNGTASSNFTIHLNLQKEVYLNGSYTIGSFNLTSNRIDLYFNLKSGGYTSIYQLNVKTSQIITYTDILNKISLFLVSGSTYNLTIKLMLVEGSTPPTEFSQGFEGIKTEYPTNVTVVGRNLWDEQWELGAINTNGQLVDSTTQIRSKNYIEVLPNSSYYFCNIDNTYTIYAFEYDKNYNFIRNLNGLNTIVTTSSTCAYLKFYVNEHNTYNYNICINKSNEAINGKYYPYIEHNLPQTNIINYVSTQLQTNHSWTQENASKWLGLGVSDSNIIDYVNKKAIVKYGIVDLGTLEWVATSTSNVYETHSLKDYVPYKGFTSSYSNETSWVSASNLANKKILLRSDVVLIRDDTYTDIDTFRQAMQGVMLIYELATPIEIDLSSLETEEHFECESNGSIIHDNLANYKYSFPVSLKGQVELNFEHDKEQQRDIDSLKKEIDLKANKSDVSESDTGLNKSLYNLGAFDTISGNVITRQTGYYIFSGTETWKFYGDSFWYTPIVGLIASNPLLCSNGIDVNCNANNQIRVYLSSNPSITSSTDMNSVFVNGVALQYKLATSYTEEIIEGQPLITLDNQGSQWLREEWEKGLNIWDEQWEVGRLNATTGIKEDGNSNTIRSKNFIKCLPNTSYKNYVKNLTNLVMYVFFYDISGKFISKRNRYCNFDTEPFVTPNNCYYLMFYLQAIYGTTYNNDIMINEGDHAYPYRPYDSKAHITNYEANFLKEEFEKGLNLLENIGVQRYDFDNLVNGKNYTISFDLSASIGCTLFDGNSNVVYTSLLSGHHSYTFTKNEGAYIWFSNANDVSNIMLNEGGHALPYQPYEGKILHEADGNGTLLWQNGSPNSAFDNQTITTADMNKFKYIVVGFKQNSGTDRATQYIKIKNELDKYAFFVSMGDGTSTENKYLRGFRLSSSTTVEFLYGFTNNTRDSNVCIPVEIYGTNVL